MHIRWHMRFDLHKYADDPIGRLRLRVTLHKQPRMEFIIDVSIAAAHWDAAAQRCTGGATMRQANRLIDQWRTAAGDIIQRFECLERRIPTNAEFRELLAEETAQAATAIAPAYDLYAVLDRFMEEQSRARQWEKRTLQKWATLRRDLKAFRHTLLTLDEDTANGFVAYLLATGERNSTVAKKVDYLKWFINWATRKGLMQPFYFAPRIKNTPKEVIYLTPGEIKQLEAIQVPPHLSRVRDVFLFCCWTGLRYSDVAKLRHADIKGGRMEIVTAKTRDALVIDLNRHALAILARHMDEPSPLPVISAQKMNEYLKELGRLAGLDATVHVTYYRGSERVSEERRKWEVLSTHCARRTFVVTALALGIPSEVIMSWTGHKSAAAMKPYVAIVNDVKRRAMSRFDSL